MELVLGLTIPETICPFFLELLGDEGLPDLHQARLRGSEQSPGPPFLRVSQGSTPRRHLYRSSWLQQLKHNQFVLSLSPPAPLITGYFIRATC